MAKIPTIGSFRPSSLNHYYKLIPAEQLTCRFQI
jgi:hypothetical protein